MKESYTGLKNSRVFPWAYETQESMQSLSGVDPARAGALNERAALAERDGIRGVMAITLDKSYPPELGDRATYENYRGRYLANDPVNFALAHRMLLHHRT